MFADIAEAPKPVAPAAGASAPVKLETVPENSKVPARGLAKAPGTANGTPPAADAPKEFPTKTDKPRPHVCLTCKRSFARLEHLKRHERSHTKEKPFECPECTRCFARRDLLLRHQQKLHMTTTPSSRPRGGRRESTSSTISTSGKIRKNSTVHPNASMRPRANTISNIGNPALEMFTNNGMGSNGIHSPQPMMVFGRVIDDIHMMRPHMVPGHHGVPSGLPKINTSIANVDMSGGLRTAPVFTDPGFGMDDLFSPDSTVNPAVLHFSEGPHAISLDSPSPFQELPGMHMGQMPMDMSASMDWIGDFGADLSMMNTNDSQAIAGSSPSIADPDSPEDASEYAQDRKPSFPQHTAQWQGNHFHKSASALPEYMMDMGLNDPFPQGPPSPSLMHDFIPEGHFPTPHFHLQNPLMNPMTPPMHGLMGQQFPPPIRGAESPSTMASTTDTSARHSSVGTGFSICIPEATRNAMMITLAQPSTNVTRQYSQPTISSPLSPGFAAKAQQAVNMPSTAEFQRYIVAYIKYFHPHMPFFHVPTLSFDIPFSSGQSANGRSNSPVFGAANSGGCLILAMSAIGALYEGETEVSKTLFNFSKRMLQMFMSEKIKAESSTGFNASKDNGPAPPPVWIVQAMLLNVIYGHMCGEKTSETIAQQHGAALIGLARAANLLIPSKRGGPDARVAGDNWNPRGEDAAWYEWRIAEEKKRTLYCVFNMSSFLTSAYNHSPALRNGEISLDLPCDEDLWAAESAEAWYALGGNLATAEQNNILFSLALNNLLTAHTRQPIPKNQLSQAFCKPNSPQQNSPDWPHPGFHASTFGCLVLINALHNYIWETRQRHNGRRWTAGETDNMVCQIEPALVAWQALWSAIPHHSVERPNQFGMGPLAADSIPLLDLAYLILTVNLGKSKECFWNRNFEEMSREIASGHEILQHAELDAEVGQRDGGLQGDAVKQAQMHQRVQHPPRMDMNDARTESRKASRRERHLRKAAAHAANSLVLGARTNNTFADFTSRELPIQAGICVFTCAQVLAEWVATLQERVGPYLGILGVDHIDLRIAPAVVLLDEEDINLLHQIMEILTTAELKMSNQGGVMHNGRFSGSPEDPQAAEFGLGMGNGEAGYAARLLHISGKMLNRSCVWPVMKLMNQGLNVQARFMKERAERSRMPSNTDQLA